MVIDVSLSLSLSFDEDVVDDDVRFCGDLSFLNTFTLSLSAAAAATISSSSSVAFLLSRQSR